MGKVQLRIASSLAGLRKAPSGWLVLEKESGQLATIGELLADVVSSYPNLRKVIFNPDTGEVSNKLNIILNDSLLPITDVIETRISGGETITIVPVYAGG